jgi:LacI family transcriptional regulator
MNRDLKTRVTIHDVAEQAGVSFQTVSRVINHRPDVAMETRLRVQTAIEELGYQPNAVARSLVNKRTNVLGLVTIDFEDYFFAGVCHGVQEEARRQGYLLMITSTDRSQELEREYVQRLHSQRVDGIIVIRDTLIQMEMAPMMDLNGLPVVVTSIRLEDEPAVLVDMDNENGGQQVAEHLIKCGHREFAIISAPPQYQVTQDRNKGFLTELLKHGLKVDPARIMFGDWHYEGGYQAAQKLLPFYPAFSAIFVQNDDMAIGAIRAIHEAGLRVPDDISLVGYDDVPVAAHLEIPLTTVCQPRHEMGAMIVRLVTKMINNEIINPRDRILLQPHLVSRATVKIRNS